MSAPNNTGLIVSRDPDRVYGPDVMYFEDAKDFGEVDENFADTPPLISIEVLSPNDHIGTVNRRIENQLRFGIAVVWLLDPDSQIVTVYRRGSELYAVDDTEELTGDAVLPEFRCKVADFFTLPGQ